MSDPVNEPCHYRHPSGIEVINITRYESFLRGNILKYVLRAPYKGQELQDLEKAAVYLEWEIERVRREKEGQSFNTGEIKVMESFDDEPGLEEHG
jgi:hypothetical protein